MKGRIPDVYSISRARKIFTGVCLSLFIMVGTVSAGVGVAQISNYIHPWYFGLLSGLTGALIGWVLAKLFQQHLLVNRSLQREYWQVIFLLAMGFAGIFILFWATINSTFSRVQYCNGYILEAKGELLGKHKEHVSGNLGFMINRKQTIISCSMDYLNQVTISQNLVVCSYVGGLGFEFYKLPSDTTWSNR